MAKVLCMELGRSIVRIAEVNKSGKNVNVLKTAVFETKEDLTKDGKVRVSEEVISEIREGLNNAKVTATEIFFVVDSSRILYKTVEIPFVQGRQVESTLQLSFSDMFPVDESLYHLSYINKGTIKKNDQKMLALEVFAVPNDLSESYYSLAVSLGLSPKGLADATHSVATLLSDTFKNRNVATISIGEVSSAISILVDGAVMFSKSIPIGIDNTIGLVRNKLVERRAMSEGEESQDAIDEELSVSALENLYTKNIVLEEMPKTIEIPGDEMYALRYDATTSLSGLIAAIETNLTQFLQKENITIQDVILTGLGAGIANISKLFAYSFGTSVKVIQQDHKLSFDKKMTTDDQIMSLACYPAIGATIDKSNLFTKAEKAGGDLAKRKKIDRVFTIVGIVCLAGGVVFGLINIFQAINDRDAAERDNTTLTNNIQHFQTLGVEQKYDEYSLSASYNEEVKGIYEETKSGNEDMTEFLKELESNFPASAVISSINMNPSSSDITVMCEDKYVAAGVLHLMRGMKTIKSMQCSSVGEDDLGNIVFTVHFDLKSTLEKQGLVDENGNPINPDDENDENEENGGNEENNGENGENGENTNAEYTLPTIEINNNADDLGVFTINGQEFDSSTLLISQFEDAAFNESDSNIEMTSILYDGKDLIPLGNAIKFTTGEDDEIIITLGTLDKSRVYSTQIDSAKAGAFSIESLGLVSGMTIEEAEDSLSSYTPVVFDDGTSEYLIKGVGTTVKLTFGAAEVIPESGVQVYRLTSMTVIANTIAEMML